MNDKNINVGLASFGMSGKVFHAPIIEQNPNLNLKLIVERSKTNSKEIYPNARIVTDFCELLNSPEIDLIVINTPTYLHFEMAKQALLAGKHIVLEKPMTATSLEAEELIKIAENKNLVIAVYHSKRFEGGFKTVKKLITEKKIGEVTNCHISMHRYKPEIGPKVWKEGDFPGAGLLYDIGSHLIDQCLVLFGWPLEIDADLQIQRKEGQVIDYFFITLKYKHFNATITSDMFTKEEKPSFTIEGTKATFIKYGKDPQEARLIEGNINWEQLGDDDEEKYGILTHNNSNTHEHIPTEKGAYYDFYQNIHEVIRHNVPLLITPDQALNVIKMIEWVQKTAPTIIATRDN